MLGKNILKFSFLIMHQLKWNTKRKDNVEECSSIFSSFVARGINLCVSCKIMQLNICTIYSKPSLDFFKCWKFIPTIPKGDNDLAGRSATFDLHVGLLLSRKNSQISCKAASTRCVALIWNSWITASLREFGKISLYHQLWKNYWLLLSLKKFICSILIVLSRIWTI